MRALTIHILLLFCSTAITITAMYSMYMSLPGVIPIISRHTDSVRNIFPTLGCQTFCRPNLLGLRWPMVPICAAGRCPHLTDTESDSETPETPSSGIIENHNQYNFALDVAGAQVIYQMTSSTQGLTLWCRMKRWWTGGEASCDHEFVLPTEVIRAGDAMEGECWTFEGGSGHITIRLSETVKISSLTIQQVKPFAPQGSSQAPRGIALWGLVSQAVPMPPPIPGLYARPADFHTHRRFPLPDGMQPTDIFTLLAQLEYDDSESTSSIQMFPIQHPDFLAGFRVVILDVTSNWGSNLTCISRVKIHGIPV